MTFRTIWIAAQATAFEAVINRRRKTAVLINAYRLARMIRQTLAAACRLYAAVMIAVNEPVAFMDTFMLVQIAIEAIVQRLYIQWMQTAHQKQSRPQLSPEPTFVYRQKIYM